MAKVQQISEITPSFAFTEFDFYKDYEESFKKSEIGRIHALLPLHEMAVRFGLVDAHPRKKAGRKPYFSPEGKVALMFLKSYTGWSAPKLMEQLNANIHYQIFCGIRISSANPLTNYKLIDDIILELSNRLKIQNQQKVLAEAWKPYMKDLDTLYTDATCYESAMRYPTDAKLLWECIEKVYPMMCEASRELGIHRMRTKYLDVSRDNMAKCNNILIDGMSFIEKLSFNAFNEGTRLVHCVKLAEKLFGEKITKLGGDCSYSGNDNRTFCSDENIVTSFVQKGKKREASASVSLVRKELARVRATAMEGSFGTQKEHYGLKRINGRIKRTEILIIFFGIHIANVVQLARRIAKAELCQAA